MIRTIISDIGNVLSGFTWYDFYKSKGYSEEMVERLAKATVKSDAWKEYDRGVLSEEEILNRFIANDPELEEDLYKTLANVRGIMKRYDYAIPWIEELKAKGYQFLVLSNFSRKVLRECWSDLDFLPYVDGGILSCQDKLIKPMPENLFADFKPVSFKTGGMRLYGRHFGKCGSSPQSRDQCLCI